MNINNDSKICEAEENTCKKEVRALCFHCSKNLCGFHLMQHVQLIEDKTRTELHSLADKFNELSLRFDQLFISDDILKKPFVQLEKWRAEAHKEIDHMADKKYREINDKIDMYQKEFAVKKDEQMRKMNEDKKLIAELIQQSDASREQIVDLRTSIDEVEMFLNTLNTHKMSIIAKSPVFSIDVYTQFFDVQATSVDELREFKIIYVRLNGLIRNYYIKTKRNGKMIDLIKSFIGHYTAVEEFTQVETNQAYTIDHLPKSDFVFPVEVYNHRVHLIFGNNASLNSILDGDVIVFYETSYSLDEKDSPWILMPCCFRRLSNQNRFGWPVNLKVPRRGCRGQHVHDALHVALDNFFRFNPNTDQHLYDASFEFIVNYKTKKTKLNDVLQDEIDFSKVGATLLVDIDSQIANKYEQNIGSTQF